VSLTKVRFVLARDAPHRLKMGLTFSAIDDGAVSTSDADGGAPQMDVDKPAHSHATRLAKRRHVDDRRSKGEIVGAPMSNYESEPDNEASDDEDAALAAPARSSRKPAKFVSQLVKMINECDEIYFDRGTVIIPSPAALEKRLSHYYKSGKYATFQRQLNHYGYQQDRDVLRDGGERYRKVRGGETVTTVEGLLSLRPLSGKSNPVAPKNKKAKPSAPGKARVSHASFETQLLAAHAYPFDAQKAVTIWGRLDDLVTSYASTPDEAVVRAAAERVWKHARSMPKDCADSAHEARAALIRAFADANEAKIRAHGALVAAESSDDPDRIAAAKHAFSSARYAHTVSRLAANYGDYLVIEPDSLSVDLAKANHWVAKNFELQPWTKNAREEQAKEEAALKAKTEKLEADWADAAKKAAAKAARAQAKPARAQARREFFR